MPKPKCKYCLEEINKEDKYIHIELTKLGKEKRISLHNKCIEEYKELMEYKANELYWFTQVYEQLMELLEYNSNQKLPSSLITRIQDLRNGTIMKKGEGRVVKSKDGYKYEIIFDCLLASGDNIRWAMKNKTFKNESNRINYLMVITESNINDSYISYEQRQRGNVIINFNNMINEEIEIQKRIENINNNAKTINTKDKNGISKFLDNEDL